MDRKDARLVQAILELVAAARSATSSDVIDAVKAVRAAKAVRALGQLDALEDACGDAPSPAGDEPGPYQTPEGMDRASLRGVLVLVGQIAADIARIAREDSLGRDDIVAVADKAETIIGLRGRRRLGHPVGVAIADKAESIVGLAEGAVELSRAAGREAGK